MFIKNKVETDLCAVVYKRTACGPSACNTCNRFISKTYKLFPLFLALIRLSIGWSTCMPKRKNFHHGYFEILGFERKPPRKTLGSNTCNRFISKTYKLFPPFLALIRLSIGWSTCMPKPLQGKISVFRRLRHASYTKPFNDDFVR